MSLTIPTTMYLDGRRFAGVFMSGLVVTSAVVLKNGTEQLLKKPVSNRVFGIGMLIFVLGWALVAHNLTRKIDSPRRNGAVYASIVGIVCAVSVLMLTKRYGVKHRGLMVFAALFALSWIALGRAASTGRPRLARALGPLAGFFVVLSMLMFLPWQRKHCVVDGFGMIFFMLGWLLLALSSSIQFPVMRKMPLSQ